MIFFLKLVELNELIELTREKIKIVFELIDENIFFKSFY